MPKFRRRSPIIEGTQWFKPGDHPSVKKINLSSIGDGIGNEEKCQKCGILASKHGIIDGTRTMKVCPGDWIANEPNLGPMSFSEKSFNEIYELYDDPVETKSYPCSKCGKPWDHNTENKCLHCGNEIPF